MIWAIHYDALTHQYLNDGNITHATAFVPQSPEALGRYVDVGVNVRFDRYGNRRSPHLPQQRSVPVAYTAVSAALLADYINTLKFQDVGKTGTITYTDAAGYVYTSTAALLRVDDQPPLPNAGLLVCLVVLVIDEQTPIVRIGG
jgi:hypothetical protein